MISIPLHTESNAVGLIGIGIQENVSAAVLETVFVRVEPDDVSVLYFDPQPNGTTKVKRLRVSADGDFLDRWPRGFFTERDEDLFDE